MDAGGLVAYREKRSDLWRRAAAYVDKILKGAKPADFPMEQPTKIDRHNAERYASVVSTVQQGYVEGGEAMASLGEELLISADSHIIEEPHFWEQRLPASFKDQAPVSRRER